MKAQDPKIELLVYKCFPPIFTRISPIMTRQKWLLINRASFLITPTSYQVSLSVSESE